MKCSSLFCLTYNYCTCFLSVLFLVHCISNTCQADDFTNESIFNNYPFEVDNETSLMVRNGSSLDSDSDIDTSNFSTCECHPWLVGNECKCADSLDGTVYCDIPKTSLSNLNTVCLYITEKRLWEGVHECPPEKHIRNVILYVVVSYVPLTVFLC